MGTRVQVKPGMGMTGKKGVVVLFGGMRVEEMHHQGGKGTRMAKTNFALVQGPPKCAYPRMQCWNLRIRLSFSW
jgi:hypothetical protein